MRGFFGEGIAEHLMIPYAKKIWTVEPSTMDFSWIGRRVPDARCGADHPRCPGRRGGAGGGHLQLLVHQGWRDRATPHGPGRAGAERPPGEDRRTHRAARQTGGFRRWQIVPFDQLIFSLPLCYIPRFIPNLPPEVQSRLRGLRYQGIYCVNVGVDREAISDKHWIYYYEDEFPFHRLSLPANFSPDCVPPGKSSIATEVAFSDVRPLDKDTAVEKTIEGLIAAKLITPDDNISLIHTEEILPAYIIYDLNHAKYVAIIREYLGEHTASAPWAGSASGSTSTWITPCAAARLPPTRFWPTAAEPGCRWRPTEIRIRQWRSSSSTGMVQPTPWRCCASSRASRVHLCGSSWWTTDRAMTLWRSCAGRHPTIELVETGENRGFAGGNLVGLRHACECGEFGWVLLINNDVAVDRGFLPPLVEACLDPRVGAAAPKIYYFEPRNLIWAAGGRLRLRETVTEEFGQGEEDGPAFSQPADMTYLTTCCLLIPRDALEKVGPLDPVFFIGVDDADWSRRAVDAGYRLRYVPDSRIWHKVAVSTGGSYTPFKTFHTGRSNTLYARRHFGPLGLLTFLGANAAALTGALAQRAAKGQCKSRSCQGQRSLAWAPRPCPFTTSSVGRCQPAGALLLRFGDGVGQKLVPLVEESLVAE